MDGDFIPHSDGAFLEWVRPYCRPASVNNLTNSAFDTKNPHVIAFDEPERDKALYICPRWENGKGEKGPWGEIVKTIIPYGFCSIVP